jgi:hypothetical protein
VGSLQGLDFISQGNRSMFSARECLSQGASTFSVADELHEVGDLALLGGKCGALQFQVVG